MANETQSEIAAFVLELSQFRAALPVSRQAMLDAILAAAEAADEENDTVGQGMIDPYTAPMLAKARMEDMQRESEVDRLAHAASQAPDEARARAVVQGRFDWLAGWLAGLVAHHAAVRPAHHSH